MCTQHSSLGGRGIRGLRVFGSLEFPFLDFRAYLPLPEPRFLQKQFLGQSLHRQTGVKWAQTQGEGSQVSEDHFDSALTCMFAYTPASTHPPAPHPSHPMHTPPPTLTLALTGTGPGTCGFSSTVFHLLILHAQVPTAPTPSLMLFSRAMHVPSHAQLEWLILSAVRLNRDTAYILRASSSSTVGGTFNSMWVLWGTFSEAVSLKRHRTVLY